MSEWRGSKVERGTIYFNALKKELKVQGDDRCVATDYPWDDEPISIMEDLYEEKKTKESMSSSSSSSSIIARALSIEEKLEMERRKKERDDETQRYKTYLANLGKDKEIAQ